jgi:hypothetical protein
MQFYANPQFIICSWEAFKEAEGVSSRGIDELLKLVGLKKLKIDFINIFKSAHYQKKQNPKPSKNGNNTSENQVIC